VEELGSEVIVHARVAELGSSLEIETTRAAASDDRAVASTVSNLVTKMPAHSSCRPGDIVTVFIDPANVHCFDPAGPSLRSGARG
jgi:ABC-type sugar transport system ATPase subunit